MCAAAALLVHVVFTAASEQRLQGRGRYRYALSNRRRRASASVASREEAASYERCIGGRIARAILIWSPLCAIWADLCFQAARRFAMATATRSETATSYCVANNEIRCTRTIWCTRTSCDAFVRSWGLSATVTWVHNLIILIAVLSRNNKYIIKFH